MPRPDFTTMPPRRVEAYIREKIREYFGDAVENDTDVIASHGFFTVDIAHGSLAYRFANFRKKDAAKILKALKLLAGE